MLSSRGRNDATYTEGFAVIGGFAVDHAWLTDRDGAVIDVAWSVPGDSYLGALIPDEEVTRIHLAAKAWGRSCRASWPTAGLLIQQPTRDKARRRSPARWSAPTSRGAIQGEPDRCREASEHPTACRIATCRRDSRTLVVRLHGAPKSCVPHRPQFQRPQRSQRLLNPLLQVVLGRHLSILTSRLDASPPV